MTALSYPIARAGLRSSCGASPPQGTRRYESALGLSCGAGSDGGDGSRRYDPFHGGGVLGGPTETPFPL
jgi:hypothetical protein